MNSNALKHGFGVANADIAGMLCGADSGMMPSVATDMMPSVATAIMPSVARDGDGSLVLGAKLSGLQTCLMPSVAGI